jgi:ATP-binding cassette subfamily B protein
MTLLILWIGGNQVISNTISIGDFNAFFMYAGILFTPIFILSFIGTFISRAMISIERITDVLEAPIMKHDGTYSASLRGDIVMKNVSLSYGEKKIIKNVSLSIKNGQRVALVGPTAAGKTQLFYLLTGLLLPTSGEILIDSHPVSEYDPKSLFSQIGLVFQDSIVFNTSVRENIQFDSSFSEDNLTKAITTAELDEVIAHLPDGLQTTVSERGTDLSGGQKQRLMLARALAISPKILLLDDFTARVDRSTEAQIFQNLDKNYLGITLINITQKIEPVKDYDRIILMIEGEIVAQGTHTELMESSFDYRKIFESQQTINK